MQAGGCLGLWPAALAREFRAVYTFEPDVENFRRMKLPANVYAFNAALAPSFSELDRSSTFCGGYFVKGAGLIPGLKIDAFEWPEVDFIWLDIEGGEAVAIDGARETIARHRPHICLEKLFVDVREIAASIDYEVIAEVGNDAVLAPR